MKRQTHRENIKGWQRQRLEWYSCQVNEQKGLTATNSSQEEARKCPPLQVLEPFRHLDLGLQASRTVKEWIPVVLSPTLWSFLSFFFFFVVLSYSSPGRLIWGTREEACTWCHPTVPWCEVELWGFTPQLKGLTWSVYLPFGKSKQSLLMFSFSASLYFFTVGQRSLKPTWWFHLPVVSVA